MGKVWRSLSLQSKAQHAMQTNYVEGGEQSRHTCVCAAPGAMLLLPAPGAGRHLDLDFKQCPFSVLLSRIAPMRAGLGLLPAGKCFKSERELIGKNL